MAALIRIIASALAFAGCTAAAGAKLGIVDDAGATVVLAAPAARIVSLAPHATELVYAAGAGDRLVGVVEGSDWPSAARALPRIGDVHSIDLERIFAMKPDLVVTWPYTTPAQVAQLRARGIAVVMTDPKTIDGIASALERIGTLVGGDATARARADAIRGAQTELRVAHARAVRIRVFYEIWDAPLYTIGGAHLITQALDVCGADNVFAALTLPAPSVSVEAVLAAAPDAIVAAFDGGAPPKWLGAWRRWPQLPATRYGNFDTVDANLLHRPGPRFVDGVRQLCDAIDAARARVASRGAKPVASTPP